MTLREFLLDYTAQHRRQRRLRAAMLTAYCIGLALLLLGGLAIYGVLPGWVPGLLFCCVGGAAVGLAHDCEERLIDVQEDKA